MRKIDFKKIEEFLRINCISNPAFYDAVGINISDWKLEKDVSKSSQWLVAAANLFQVPCRILEMNTLRVVVDDLIERSWESNKTIDREGILQGEIGDLELTLAESILLYEGSETGIANCTLQLQDEFEFQGFVGKANLIRTEIIEWFLNPSVSRLLIKSGSLSIIGAVINTSSGRLFEPIRQHVSVGTSVDSLDLSNSIIGKDLFFTRCTFNVHLIFDNTSIQSLVLDGCVVKGNISANNLLTNGDVRVLPGTTSRILPGQNIDKSPEQEYDIRGYFRMEYSNVSGAVEVLNLRVRDSVSISYLHSDLLIADGLKCGGDLYLQYGDVKKIVSMNSIKIEKNVYASGFKCQTLAFDTSEISGMANFSNLQCDDAWFSGSHFSGDEISLDLAGCQIRDVMLNNGFFARCGVHVFRSKISAMLDCSDSIFGPTSDGFSLRANSCQFATLRLHNSIFLGCVSLANASVNLIVTFGTSVFVAPPQDGSQLGLKAIDCYNIISGKEISFRPANGIVKNRYEVVKEIKPPEPNQKGTGEPNNVNEAFEEYERFAKPLNILRETKPEYFYPLDDIITKPYYDVISTVIIGEGSFENAEINGRIDFAGSSFFNLQVLSLPSEKENWLRQFDARVSTTIFGKFLALIYLVPLMFLQMASRLLHSAQKSLGIITGHGSCKEYGSTKWGLFFNDWLKPKTVDWPNALTLSHTHIKGDLFLNKGPRGKDAPFRAIGEVNMHSATVENFFLSPSIGADPLVRWRIVGLKYEFIYSDNSKDERLEDCNWFFNYMDEDNFRQPYEQLAGSYLKMGNDTRARKVLMRTPGGSIGEKMLMAVLSFMAYISLPSYRALVCLLLLWVCGTLVFKDGENRKEIIRENPENHIRFSPEYYSFQLLIPFISSPQKDAFEPSYLPGTRPISIGYRPSWLPSVIPENIKLDWVYAYHSVHSFFGAILISLFLLGIARIIRSR